MDTLFTIKFLIRIENYPGITNNYRDILLNSAAFRMANVFYRSVSGLGTDAINS